MSITSKVQSFLLHVGMTAFGLHVLAAMCPAQDDLWLPVADMTTARVALGATVADGRLFAIGGSAAFPSPILTSIEAYDPATDAWAARSDMPTGRRWLSAATVGEKIYAVGGEQLNLQAMPTVEEYDIRTDAWTTIADMPTPRKAASAAAVDGKVYVIGGASSSGQLLASVDVYDPVTNTWEPRARMPTARALLSTSVVDGKIYAFGGGPGTASAAVEEYDPATDTWTRKTSMPTARWSLATTVADGTIFVGGGRNANSSTPTVEKYDPLTDQWTVTTPLPVDSIGLGAAAIDNQVYAIGGVPFAPGAPVNARSSVYRFDTGSLDRPSVVLSTLGEAYAQAFDGVLGPDGGNNGILLPDGWLGTTEHNYEVVDGQFSTTRTLRSGNFFNAGLPDDSDRALVTRVPRTEREGSGGALEFRGTVQGNDATQMRLQFDLEAWGAKSRSASAPAGEAAFHLMAGIDSGSGFQELLDLGTVTTGASLFIPDDRLINGNQDGFRTNYDSGWLNNVFIPEDATLRLRWTAETTDTTRGWTFGLDNVRLELGVLGDVNRDGQLNVDDIDLLALEIANPSGNVMFDLDQDGRVGNADHLFWVKELKRTWIGDADLDGEFNSGDLITVFQAGKYEDSEPMNATWASGDWNGDAEFDSGDLVLAFQDAGYEQGPRVAVAAVPEPCGLALMMVTIVALPFIRRHQLFNSSRL